MAERSDSDTRIYEPSLREVASELHGCTKSITALRELLLAKLDAQAEALIAADKRYEQRFVAQEGAVASALTAQEKAVGAALIAADRAVSKVETANEKRFESVNEFRAQLADQAAGFLPRNEATIRFDSVAEKVDTSRRIFEDKHEQLRAEVQIIRTDQTLSSGKGVGYEKVWGWIVGAIGGGGVLGFIIERMVNK